MKPFVKLQFCNVRVDSMDNGHNCNLDLLFTYHICTFATFTSRLETKGFS